jgi:hypothetical protein
MRQFNSKVHVFTVIKFKSWSSGLWRRVVMRQNNTILEDLAASSFTQTTTWDSAIQFASSLVHMRSILILQEAGNFSLHYRVQNGSGVHPASYPIGTRGSFSGGKAAEAWSWPLTSIWCRGQECAELYLNSSNTPSLRGAQLQHRDNFILPYIYLSCLLLWRQISCQKLLSSDTVISGRMGSSACSISAIQFENYVHTVRRLSSHGTRTIGCIKWVYIVQLRSLFQSVQLRRVYKRTACSQREKYVKGNSCFVWPEIYWQLLALDPYACFCTKF